MNKVSVIIPCYNSQHYLSDCLNSVLAQTFKNLEVICVDDGSTDGTRMLLDQFKKQYPHLFTVVSTPNNGASAARNYGLQLSRGNYIQFLDSDDIITPEKLEQQLAFFFG
jgi:teichuronic acid biosynthesis glycosyltransferase TuaG